MTEDEVLERNKLIAEFMEYKPCFSHITDKYDYTQTVDGFLITGKCNCGNHQEDEFENFAIKHLKFHSSWDWLMPVVEKIESMGYYVYIHESSCLIGNKYYKDSRENCDRISDVDDISKITATFIAVTKFIKWNNENKINK